ncbi:MAG TPA: putative leader peptide [Pseudonocardia sp.]
MSDGEGVGSGPATPLSVTLLRTRRHVDLCRTATAICRS